MADIPNPIDPFVQADILDLYERILPDHYLQPIRDIGPGYELLQAFAKMFARVSSSVATLGADAQISTAQGGAKATGTVQLYRAAILESGSEISGQAGISASIVAGAPGGQMRVTGLTGMSASSVGRFLVLANTFQSANLGGFAIVTFNSQSSVDVTNAFAVIPDANNGNISWSEETRVVIVKKGTVVATSTGGKNFLTQGDVTFQPTDLGPFNVAVAAEAVGYEYNVTGQVTAADGTLLPGEIDTMLTLIEDPAMGDVLMLVKQITSTSGGIDASLDALGSDRGIERSTGEADDKYRIRVRALPDTISPNAFNRVITNILAAANNSTFSLLETWDATYQTCWDGPSGTFAGSSYSPTLFVYDDPRANYPFRNRWLDLNDFRGGVIVVVDNIQPLSDVGMIWDDTALNATALVSSITGGMRACCAYDVPSTLAFGYLQGGFDGFDLNKQSLYKGLYDTLQGTKAAGVSAVVELKTFGG